MFIYILVFIIALLYYLFAKGKWKNSSIILALFFVYIALFIGFGDMIGGYDRYIYGEVFDTISDETSTRKNYSALLYLVHGHEYGYFLWQIMCSFITQNRYVFILLSSLLMYALFFRAFKLYIENYPLATLVFLGIFYYFTITYTRQVLACGFAWQGIQYVWQRKFWRFFLWGLLAYSFHNSAIVFLLIYFLPIRKYSKRSIIIIMLLCTAIGFTPLPTVFMSSLGGDRTEKYVDEMSGFRPEYILEAIVFMSVFFSGYNKISSKHKELVFLNMGLVFCALLLLFMRFGEGGRFGWYFLMGIIYLLTKFSNAKGVYGRIMSIFTIALSCMLFMRVSYSWSFNLVPYKTFLTDGYPSGARWIYEQYEYNHLYTTDKFCRPAFYFINSN